MNSILDNSIKLVVNPTAGGFNGLGPEHVGWWLSAHRIPYDWVTVDELVTLGMSPGPPIPVLVLGGDGTLHHVINTLGLSMLPRFVFAVLPLGTGNDFARSLATPLNLDEAMAALLEGEVRAVDLGLINHRVCFTCAVSLGFGPEVTRLVGRSWRWMMGKWALYFGAAFKLFSPHEILNLRIKWDHNPDISRVHTPQLVIGNARTHGGGVPISGDAHLENALLDVYYYKPVSLKQTFAIAYRLCKRLDHTLFPEVRYRQAQVIHLFMDKPKSVDVDGELYRFYRHMEIEVLPGQLNVLCPLTQPTTSDDETVQNFSRNLVG
jgi:YegS/Rv2252/BmrU family lipid kinase